MCLYIYWLCVYIYYYYVIVYVPIYHNIAIYCSLSPHFLLISALNSALISPYFPLIYPRIRHGR